MYVTLISNVLDPVHMTTNTRASFTTTLGRPLKFTRPKRVCVHQVVYPMQWDFQGGSPPNADARFFVKCDLFRYKATIGQLDRHISHVGPPCLGQDAIFAFVPEPARTDGLGSHFCLKEFEEYFTIGGIADLNEIRVDIVDSSGKPIDFKTGSVILTLIIEDGE